MSPLGHTVLGGKRSSVSSYASTGAGSDATEAYARAYVQSEVGAAARLRSTETSLADGRLHSLHSGTPGPPAPAPLKTEEQNRSLMDNNVMRQTVKMVAPILWVFVVYGLIPVRFKRFKPARMSLHPLRSTLLYVLAVQTLISWSGHQVYASFSGLLHSEPENARGVDERLLATMSIVHVLSHVVVLVIWFEVPRAVKCRVHLVDFAENYIEMVGEQPYSKGTRFVRWYTLAFCFVLAPFLVVIWCNYILRKPFLTHGPSHLLQFVNVISSLVVFDIACMIVRDLASNVAAKLKEELDSDRMTASRLEEFRLAWLNLRQLTVDLGSMSLTGLSMVFYLLVIVTLTSYQSAVSYYNNNILLCFASTGVLLVAQFALIHICDTAHRLKDVMFTGFYEPLASKSWRVLPADLLTEHQQFLHTISTNPAEVTFMGMISIKRPTYLSIMAAIATYLIVLFQLRMSDEDLPTKATTNSTESSLDSLFGSKTSN